MGKHIPGKPPRWKTRVTVLTSGKNRIQGTVNRDKKNVTSWKKKKPRVVHQGHKNNHELCMLQQNLTEFKGEVDKSAKIMGDFNALSLKYDKEDLPSMT